MRFDELHFPQSVQLRTCAASKAELREIKQVQFAVKQCFGTARAFRHCADPAEVGSEPIDNQTAFGKRKNPDDQAARFLDHTLSHGNSADTQRTHLSSAFFILVRSLAFRSS